MNEKAEQKAISDLITISKEILSNSFDYTIVNGDPTNNNGLWQVPLLITISKNKNYLNFTNFFYKTLLNLSMNKDELEKYAKLKKPIYHIGLFDNSNLSNSTPQISFNENYWENFNLNFNLKNYSLNYYVKYLDVDTFSLIAKTNSGAEKFKSNFIS